MPCTSFVVQDHTLPSQTFLPVIAQVEFDDGLFEILAPAVIQITVDAFASAFPGRAPAKARDKNRILSAGRSSMRHRERIAGCGGVNILVLRVGFRQRLAVKGPALTFVPGLFCPSEFKSAELRIAA